jgi:hypothetical protein
MQSQSMESLQRTPIIVGVGDIKNPSVKVEDAVEPAELMLRAIAAAIEDTKLPAFGADKLKSSVDSIDVVSSWTWPYPDLPGLLSKRLGVDPNHQHYSAHGGNQPAKLLDEASRRIATGRSKVAIVTGGEALASRRLYHLQSYTIYTECGQ